MEGINSQAVKLFISTYDWYSSYYSLDSRYILNFNLNGIFGSEKAMAQYFDLVKNLVGYFILQICPKQQKMELFELSVNIKRSYCLLLKLLKPERKSQHLDILLFISSLMAKEVFRDLTNKYYFVDKNLQTGHETSENNEHLDIEAYAYIIFVKQTTGNLICRQTFHIFRQKFIKDTIFRPQDVQESYRLIKSFKHIQQRFNNKKNIKYLKQIRKRSPRNQISQLLFSHLKIRQNKDDKKNKSELIDQVEQTFQEIIQTKNTFDHSNSGQENEDNYKNIDSIHTFLKNKKAYSLKRFQANNYYGISNAVKYYYNLNKTSVNQNNKSVCEKEIKYFRQISFCDKSSHADSIQKISNCKKTDQKQVSSQNHKWNKILKGLKKQGQKIHLQSQQANIKLRSITMQAHKKYNRSGQQYRKNQGYSLFKQIQKSITKERKVMKHMKLQQVNADEDNQMIRKLPSLSLKQNMSSINKTNIHRKFGKLQNQSKLRKNKDLRAQFSNKFYKNM